MRKNKGFTLIELMIVVAIIGILAAIAIPNYLDGIEKSRQSRSMAEIRTMVISMQTFSLDFGGYINSSYNGEVAHNWINVFDNNGDPILIPDYIQAVPAADGWGNPYFYYGGPDGASPNQKLGSGEVTAMKYCVYSLGKGGAPGGGTDGSAPGPDVAAAWCSEPSVQLGVRDTYCYESDIVWGDSSFQQSPEGKQKRCG